MRVRKLTVYMPMMELRNGKQLKVKHSYCKTLEEARRAVEENCRYLERGGCQIVSSAHEREYDVIKYIILKREITETEVEEMSQRR